MTIIVDYLDNFRNGSIWLMFNYSVAFSVHHPTHILQISSVIKGIFCSRQYFRANEPWTWIDRVVEVFSSCRWFESHLRENILFLFRNMSLFLTNIRCAFMFYIRCLQALFIWQMSRMYLLFVLYCLFKQIFVLSIHWQEATFSIWLFRRHFYAKQQIRVVLQRPCNFRVAELETDKFISADCNEVLRTRILPQALPLLPWLYSIYPSTLAFPPPWSARINATPSARHMLFENDLLSSNTRSQRGNYMVRGISITMRTTKFPHRINYDVERRRKRWRHNTNKNVRVLKAIPVIAVLCFQMETQAMMIHFLFLLTRGIVLLLFEQHSALLNGDRRLR